MAVFAVTLDLFKVVKMRFGTLICLCESVLDRSVVGVVFDIYTAVRLGSKYIIAQLLGAITHGVRL